MKNIPLPAFLFFVLFAACTGPAVTFNEAQPSGIQSLNTFNRHLKGRYLSMDDSSVITITDKCIISDYDSDLRLSVNSIANDSTIRIIKDSLLHTSSNTKIKMEIKGDTVFATYHQTDTLFMISETNVLKKFKGYYFLNTLYADHAWEVQKLSLTKGKLTIGTVSIENDIKNLKEITETESDTLQFDPSKRQFKKFIRKDGFSNEKEYIRL